MRPFIRRIRKAHTIGLTNIDDVHKFCRVTLAVIDDLPTGENLIEGLPVSLK